LVTFELSKDGVQDSWTGITGSDGAASLPARLLVEPGNYTLTASYEGRQDVYEGTFAAGSFIVEKEDTDLSLSVTGKGKESLRAILTDADDPSAGVAGVPIVFIANDGDVLGSAITDGTGRAVFDIPKGYRSKKDSFEAFFDGSTDTYWHGSSSAQ
jgi:hypothetical protein